MRLNGSAYPMWTSVLSRVSNSTRHFLNALRPPPWLLVRQTSIQPQLSWLNLSASPAWARNPNADIASYYQDTHSEPSTSRIPAEGARRTADDVSARQGR